MKGLRTRRMDRAGGAVGRKNEGQPAAERKQLLGKQLLCAVAGLVLGGALFLQEKEPVLLQDGKETVVARPGYGEDPAQIDLLVNGEKVSLQVSGRKYTPREAAAQCDRLAQELPGRFLSPEETADGVRTDLMLTGVCEGYEGIRLAWTSGDLRYLKNDGTVRKEELESPVTLELTCRMTVQTTEGTYEQTVLYPITLLPAPAETDRASAGDGELQLSDFLEGADAVDPAGEKMRLPGFWNETALSYREPPDLRPLLLPVLGLAAAVLVGKIPAEEQKKRRKERETELLLNYSEMVSRLKVYLGAGITVRNAMICLASDGTGTGGSGTLHTELRRLAADLANGMPETKAYPGFARRCGPRCYLRLAALLERAAKTGGSGISGELSLELAEAFSQRKETASRLGREAGTRLVIPLMMSLAAVLMLTALPALLKMRA